MFCLGQVGLTQFIKYPGLTWILHWIMLIMVSVSDQSNDLRVLDDNDELTVQLEYFDLSVLG